MRGPTASSSASVSAPERAMTRSAAASSWGMLLIYSVTTRFSPGAKPFFLFQPFKQLDAAAAGGVQVKHVPVRLLFPGAEVGHDLIDAVRTETAAEAQNHGAVSGVQLGARCGAGPRSAPRGGQGCPRRWFSGAPSFFNRVRAGGQHNVLTSSPAACWSRPGRRSAHGWLS